jgi:hypothetical protein
VIAAITAVGVTVADEEVDLRIEAAVAFAVVVAAEDAEAVIGVDSRVSIVRNVVVVREAIAFKSQRKMKIYTKQFCAIY